MSITVSEHIKAVTVGEGVRRKILSYNNDMMLVEVSFEAGSIGAIHSHPHKQIAYVVSGQFEFTLNDDVTLISKGDSYLVEPNQPHGVKALTAGVLVDFFTPAREDFLA
ncbi:MAG: cupin domain-containing protein [Spirochaetaceae bacterium]|nr:cupin domain-containing protein [Spirochaetaceae bacterium]